MDENTKIIITTIATSLVTIITGNGVWNYVTEKMRRRTPTIQEMAETDNSNARIALEIVASLRLDLERIKGELDQKQKGFEQELKEIQTTNQTNLEALHTKHEVGLRDMQVLYEGKITTLSQEYEARIVKLSHEYEGRIVKLSREYEERLKKSETEAEGLRTRVVNLEEERKLLLKLSEAFERAKKTGTISGDD